MKPVHIPCWKIRVELQELQSRAQEGTARIQACKSVRITGNPLSRQCLAMFSRSLRRQCKQGGESGDGEDETGRVYIPVYHLCANRLLRYMLQKEKKVLLIHM